MPDDEPRRHLTLLAACMATCGGARAGRAHAPRRRAAGTRCRPPRSTGGPAKAGTGVDRAVRWPLAASAGPAAAIVTSTAAQAALCDILRCVR
jgi:hypothetical protein